jgi:hypothetical protein
MLRQASAEVDGDAAARERLKLTAMLREGVCGR